MFRWGKSLFLLADFFHSPGQVGLFLIPGHRGQMDCSSFSQASPSLLAVFRNFRRFISFDAGLQFLN